MSTVATLNWKGDEVKRLAGQTIKASVWELGLIVEAQAIELAPKDTGRLKGSITTQMADRGTEVRAPADASDKISAPNNQYDAHVGTNVRYGEYQEFGTVRTEAQPYLRPALRIAQGETLEVVRHNGRWQFKDYIR